MATGSARRSAGRRSTRPGDAGAKNVSLTSRPSREAANRLYLWHRLRAVRDEPVPLRTRVVAGFLSARVTSFHARQQVLGRLPDLPIAIVEGVLDGAPDVVAVERSEGEHRRAFARVGLSSHAARMAGSPRASPIAPSAAAHDSRTSGSAAPVVNSISRPRTAVAHLLTLAARPCGHLDHRDIVVGEEREGFSTSDARPRTGRRAP